MNYKTEAAQAAALIRKELKEAFPEIKFSVTSQTYAGGDSVNIRYENGVTEEKVYNIVNKYTMGHFDSMTDTYEMSNLDQKLPQVKFIFASRDISEDVQLTTKKELAKMWGIENIADDREWMDKTGHWPQQKIFMELRGKDIA